MALKLPVQLLFTASSMFFSFTDTSRLIPATIEGTVVSTESGAPISGAHVYVIKGEEEALTNSEGQYRITTWQPFPVTLIIEHKNYQQGKLKIAETGKKQLVKLQQKSL